ncbi:hypothetical protein HD806DRAFT_479773 [Xylariaceae sp. AK1471]|nr:hypothetical protein HD806DRAFT_479773 [Xylariaceae sp. AK1471]
MEHLPSELIQRIFIYLDLKSLGNAALSCRVLLNAFKGAETLITSEMLLSQIDLDVLPEAILVNESWHLGDCSIDTAIEFAKNNLQSRKPAPLQWTLAEALPLERFHRYVNCLTADMSLEALKTKNRLLTPREPFIWAREMFRFERAFYRFQLYCNIVGKRFPVEDGELKDMFFGYFAAWENEQLACVHEFLVRIVATPFNYLVDHDVTWGYMGIPYIDRHFSGYAQEILSQGLEKVYHLSRASTYEQYRNLLKLGEDRWNEPGCVQWFLYRGLEKGANWYSPVNMDSLSYLDNEDRDFVIGQPFYNDPDPGPAHMWEWVYRDCLPDNLVANPRMISHRQWGFPFWNSSRLREAFLLGNPDIPGTVKSTELELEDYDTLERVAALAQSQELRAKIWVEGGTGFFSREDQHEVVWPQATRRKGYYAQPRSLEEAKDFLKAYKKNTGAECLDIKQI